MALVVGNNLALHSLNVSQDFMQALWADLPEDIGTIYILYPRAVLKTQSMCMRLSSLCHLKEKKNNLGTPRKPGILGVPYDLISDLLCNFYTLRVTGLGPLSALS